MRRVELQLGPYRLEAYPDATRAAYAKLAPETNGCGCAVCRNFSAAREQLYAGDTRIALDALGIQWRYDWELHDFGPIQPSDHVFLYSLWFFAVAKLLPHVGLSGFSRVNDALEVCVTQLLGEPPSPFPAKQPLVKLEFMARVPWLLEEPIPKETRAFWAMQPES